ncbi:hypothetical protein X975_11987, partial [Stegodyphus mimosarum]
MVLLAPLVTFHLKCLRKNHMENQLIYGHVVSFYISC